MVHPNGANLEHGFPQSVQCFGQFPTELLNVLHEVTIEFWDKRDGLGSGMHRRDRKPSGVRCKVSHVQG